MEEDNLIDRSGRFNNEDFKMNPPVDAWNKLKAELQGKKAVIYKQRANRFKLLSITLALLLFSFTTYYYVTSSNETNNLAYAN